MTNNPSQFGSKKRLRVFEAFSGIGAQKAALERLRTECNFDYEIVGTSDWFINAIIAYDAIHYNGIPAINLPSHDKQIEYLQKYHFSSDSVKPLKDIEKLPSHIRELLYQANIRTKNLGAITDVNSQNMPDTDLLIYSFPCQDLSTGGNGGGMAKGSNTRSCLIWEIERILNELLQRGTLPEYLLMENVSAILSPRHRPELNKWLSFLKKIGYSNDEPMTLNANDFGVPQERNRTFIVSHLGDRLNVKDKLQTATIKVDTRDFLRTDYSNPTYRLEADEASLNLTYSRKVMWNINGRDIAKDTIIRTITCNMDRTNTSVLFKYNNTIRRLTIREAFLMMGFSEDEYLRMRTLNFSYRQANKLIGNAIVVNVLKELFRAMFLCSEEGSRNE